MSNHFNQPDLWYLCRPPGGGWFVVFNGLSLWWLIVGRPRCTCMLPGFGLAHWWTAALLTNDPVRVSPAYVIFREYDGALSQLCSVKSFLCEKSCLVNHGLAEKLVLCVWKCPLELSDWFCMRGGSSTKMSWESGCRCLCSSEICLLVSILDCTQMSCVKTIVFFFYHGLLDCKLCLHDIWFKPAFPTCAKCVCFAWFMHYSSCIVLCLIITCSRDHTDTDMKMI